MEKKLFNLFDFQKYEENERISKMIEETEQKFGTDIKVEDLEQVTAAGSKALPILQNVMPGDFRFKGKYD